MFVLLVLSQKVTFELKLHNMKLEKINRNSLCIIEWNGVTNHSISIGSHVQAQVSLKAIKKLEKIKQYPVEFTLIMEFLN